MCVCGCVKFLPLVCVTVLDANVVMTVQLCFCSVPNKEAAVRSAKQQSEAGLEHNPGKIQGPRQVLDKRTGTHSGDIQQFICDQDRREDTPPRGCFLLAGLLNAKYTISLRNH